jgi:hypothetical protein
MPVRNLPVPSPRSTLSRRQAARYDGGRPHRPLVPNARSRRCGGTNWVWCVCAIAPRKWSRSDRRTIPSAGDRRDTPAPELDRGNTGDLRYSEPYLVAETVTDPSSDGRRVCGGLTHISAGEHAPRRCRARHHAGDSSGAHIGAALDDSATQRERDRSDAAPASEAKRARLRG